MRRINEGILPQKILDWCAPGRRRKGRPRNSWMQEITTGMREKGIKLGTSQQRRMEKKNEIKTLDPERRANIKTLYIRLLILLLILLLLLIIL